MKYAHSYCFYMTNGEHLMFDADDMTICDEFIKLHRNENGNECFCFVYLHCLMSWEVVR